MPFARVAGIVPYLDALGITDLYVSPILAARPGSTHGYDVVDPSRLNPEIGSEEALAGLASSLRSRGMGLLLDIVPNHMCIASPLNRWWWNVLENGPGSPYARFFDIDWRPPKPELADKVLLPFLGEQYGRVLENQEISVQFDAGAFVARYYETVLPLAPKSWKVILEPTLDRLRARLDSRNPHLMEFESILTALRNLPGRTEMAPERVLERQREKEIIKGRLSALVAATPTVKEGIEASLEDLNGRKGAPSSFDRLETLLADQAYRLCHWRVASDEINYRRFFDVNELAAIRMEDPEVFKSSHETVLRWIGQGWVTGLRIDHVDGLFDPQQYLRNLQDAARQALEAAGRPAPGGERPFYVVVEKILGRGELLFPEWAAHGTTGYDFLNLLNGLFVDADGAAEILSAYSRFRKREENVPELIATCQKLIMLVAMSGELHILACALDRISEQHRWSRDFTLESQRFGLREVIARFPVYRTYIRGEPPVVSEADRKNVLRAVRLAKRKSPSVHESLFDFIAQVWLQEHPQGLSPAAIEERRRFVMRLQQYTGPVAAKGIEDTFAYRHVPMASLNEVGAEVPWRGVTAREFHERNLKNLRLWPHSLLATSTHDTKRGEDVRARVNTLSEIPEAWGKAVGRWKELNRPLKVEIENALAPDSGEEYLFYQTLLGTWPHGPDAPETRAALAPRLEEYMIKAVREAKVHTSWLNVNLPYEEALRKFVRVALEARPDNAFIPDFLEFLAPVIRAGIRNSLSQVLLKTASPGAPDFYQGTELWDLRLVDPDNRRPVDFELRARLLETLPSESESSARELIEKPDDGRIKMYVTRAALRYSRERRPLFDRGDYLPLEPRGPRADHVCAFARTWEGTAALAVAGRFFLRLGADGPEPWRGTDFVLPAPLAGGSWRDVFTGRILRDDDGILSLSEVLSVLPVALLDRVPPGEKSS
jgi:(1->4)-alpha-D-glucan 1-alpha-D-glucosylmutase